MVNWQDSRLGITTNVRFCDVVTRNISDSEVQLDLLGDSNQNMTLEEVLKFIEAKEAGKRSASRLLHTQNVDAARSSYRKDKSSAFKSKPEHSNDHCIYCGRQGHGKRSLPRVRQRQCPAYGHRCKHCSREHHFLQMCRSRDTTSNCTTSEEHEDTVFNTLCSATLVHSIGNRCSISLDHHLYNNICDQWLQRSSQQPIHWRDAVKAGIDQDIKLGVLEAVPIRQPVMWCTEWLLVPRRMALSDVQLTFNDLILMQLEKHNTRNHPSIRHALSLKEKRRRYLMLGTVITASVQLHKDDRHLTTFITPWGQSLLFSATRLHRLWRRILTKIR